MKATGAFWPEANNNPLLMARLAKAAHTIAGIESIRVPFDVSVDATAFGAITGKEGIDRQPAILEAPIKTPQALDKALVPDPTKDGRAPVVLDSIKLLAKEFPKIPVICAIVSPFMLAGQLRGSQEAIMDVAMKPVFMKGILEKATEWDIAFALAALEAGADVIALIDATSSGDVLGPRQYSEFAMPYQKRVIDAVRKADGYSILHICGKTAKNMPFMIQTGANGISVDQQMDIGWVKEQLKGKVATIGNVSPTSTLLFKKPEDVTAEAYRCMDAGTDILAPGCGFAPETPLENMKALAKAAQTYRKK
jgi:MtaA/CmuA family methyltransferase